MAQTIGRNTNVNDTATLTSITVSVSSTTVAASNANRTYLSISNDGPNTAYVKLQAASVDDIQRGDWLEKGGTWWMTPDNFYTGEVSVIAAAGTPTVHVTEY